MRGLRKAVAALPSNRVSRISPLGKRRDPGNKVVFPDPVHLIFMILF